MNEPAPVVPAAVAPVAEPAAPVTPETPVPAAPAAGIGLAADPAGLAKSATPTQEAGWWREHVSEEYRNHPSMQTIGSMDDLAKTYISGQQMIGKDKVVRVNADADNAAKQAFLKDLGWGFAAEKPEDYGLSAEGVNEFGDLTSTMNFMGELFHKHNLPTETGKAIFEEFVKNEQGQHAEDLKLVQQDKTLQVNALREELGPSYEHTMLKAQATAKQLTPDGSLMKLFTDNHLETEPSIIKLLAAHGDSILGDNLNPGGLTREFTTTPQQAQSEIATLQADAEFMKQYTTHGAPGQKDAVKKMQGLYSLAFPEQAS